MCVCRDAVVGALMPSCMMPVECPSSSPVPPSDSSSVSSPSEAEGPPVTSDLEERASPHPWQDSKRGEVRVTSSMQMVGIWSKSCVPVAFFSGSCVLIGHMVEFWSGSCGLIGNMGPFWGYNFQWHFGKELYFDWSRDSFRAGIRK